MLGGAGGRRPPDAKERRCSTSYYSPKILCEMFFFTSTAQEVVSHLQRVFQADACHMNFGKYTLYSCYGTTANCNTFPLAFAILFGNEDKDSWVQFWEFAKSLHPSLNRFDTTIITNQAKGLKEAIYQVLTNAVHFHCPFHRRQNITKIVKGGNVKYSCLWLFNKLVKAHTKQEIDHIKHKYSQFVDEKALKYLITFDDKEMYPGARCELGGRIFMYQRSASLAVESMNWANKSACARTAVDVVSSTRLLLKSSASRYQVKKVEAWKWEEALTLNGTKLRDAAFETINFQHYRINIDNADDRYECSVTRVGKGHKEKTCYFMKELKMGSAFGGCSCGVPFTDGLPRHHMVAVVKSS
jgi:hypothetical protein